MKTALRKAAGTGSRRQRREADPCADRELTKLVRLAYANPPRPGQVSDSDVALPEPGWAHGRR